MYPTADRLLHHCDAVLRLPGESTGADQDVAIALSRGLAVYHRIEDDAMGITGTFINVTSMYPS